MKLPFSVHWVRGVVTAVLFVMCVVTSGETGVLNPRFCMATPVEEGTGALKYSGIIFKLSLEHETNQLSLSLWKFFYFFWKVE